MHRTFWKRFVRFFDRRESNPNPRPLESADLREVGIPQPVLSRTALDNIRSIGQQGPELLARVVEAYLSSSPELVAAIRAAVEDEDAAALTYASHSLKSSSGNLGAVRLAELCAEAEAAGKRNAPGEVARFVSILEREFSRACDALRGELA